MDGHDQSPGEGLDVQELRVEASLYDSLIKHRIYQDGLLWSRLQFVIAIQGGALAGGYAQRSHKAGALVMILAALVTFLILLLFVNDADDSRANEMLMDMLAADLVPSRIKREITGEIVALENCKNRNDAQEGKLGRLLKYKTRWVWFTAPAVSLPKWRIRISGTRLISRSIALLIVVDLVLSAFYATRCGCW